jgi:hypothetical protein
VESVITDHRRIKIYRIVCRDHQLNLDEGAEVYQDAKTGKLCGHGIWWDLLVPNQSDLEIQAKNKNISPLEWLKQKMEVIPYLKVEIG